MRLAALLLLVSASPAFAQAVDCEALKTTTLPYQISWTHKGTRYAYQIYRDKSGDFVAWQQIAGAAGVSAVSKSTVIDGVSTEGLVTTRQTGKNRSWKIKITTTGLPKGWDRRSDAIITSDSTTTYADASTVEAHTTGSYRFVREERKAIGPCQLKLVQGETIYTRDGKELPASTLSYLPEIRGAVMTPTEATTEFELTTRFTPFELMN